MLFIKEEKPIHIQSGAKIRGPKLVDTFIQSPEKKGQNKGQSPKKTRQKRSLILAPDCTTKDVDLQVMLRSSPDPVIFSADSAL